MSGGGLDGWFCCRYFDDSSSEEEGGGPEGESEEAVRARIAKEFHWTQSSEAPPTGGEGDEEDDPLDAFMAGIEVCSLSLSLSPSLSLTRFLSRNAD